MNAEQPNQFAAILPDHVKMMEAAQFMAAHSGKIYANLAAMVRDMEAQASLLREEMHLRDQEHATQKARLQSHINAIESMIAHHVGALRPEPVFEPPMKVIMAGPKKTKQRKVFGFFTSRKGVLSPTMIVPAK